jgi:hypothetical protein
LTWYKHYDTFNVTNTIKERSKVMSITLPTEPVPAVLDLTGNNLLVMGDYGIGKSGLLASTGYLLGDPEDKLRAYPDLFRVSLKTWQDHKDFVEAVAKKPAGAYKGVGLDSLNISYDQALTWCMENVKFAGSRLNHPSENPQLAYPRITHEFITWLRSVTFLGYHIVATCHVNVVEIRDKKGNLYNRWIPAFTGGSATSTYSSVLKIFPLVGFMALDEVVRPSTRTVMGKTVADARTDASRIADDTHLQRVIHFKQDPNWLANNKFAGFPDRVVLNDRWQDDWKLLQEAWGTGDMHELSEHPVETSGMLDTAVSAKAQATGLS